MRIGHGYDVHRFAPERELVLCGVHIEHPEGLHGHSDADVATHALIDAIFGALAVGDIGTHFPDADPRYKGARSVLLLRHAAEVMRQSGYSLGNADVTIICEHPKLAPHIAEMRREISEAMGAPITNISVKATTEEGLGFTGAGQGIAAHAVCILERL